MGLQSVDKERLIRILRYSNALLDDIYFLENLPNDVIMTIMSNLDCQTILSLCKLSVKMSKFCERHLDNILRQRLTQSTGLQTNTYNRQQLVTLCKIPSIYQNISTGGAFSLFLKNSQVYACGYNGSGQLGLGTPYYPNKPTLIPKLTDIIQVATGIHHSLFLNNKGQVFACGANYNGQLGLGGGDREKITPQLVSQLIDIVQIAAGYYYSLCLSNAGQIYSFGNNDSGQLGLGDNVNSNTPKVILQLNHIIQIVAGKDHSLVLSTTGKVYAYGSNIYGKLGLGTNKDKNIPTLINFVDVIIQISSGGNHSLFLTNAGQIYVCGSNTRGQLGLKDIEESYIPILIENLHHINKISAGHDQSLISTNTGQLYACGANDYGQLGLMDEKDKNIFTLIRNLTDIIQISAGSLDSLVLDAKGIVYAFGDNGSGQLGVRDNKKRNEPVEVMSIL